LLLLAPSDETTGRSRCSSSPHATELRLALLLPLGCLLTQVRLGVPSGPIFVVRLSLSRRHRSCSKFSLKDQLAKSKFVERSRSIWRNLTVPRVEIAVTRTD
jgi:hypothetical protein